MYFRIMNDRRPDPSRTRAQRMAAELARTIRVELGVERGDWHEKRRFARKRARWSAILHVRPQNRRAVVEDIGVGGCRLHVNSHGIAVGSRVTVEIPDQGMVLDGEVRWVRFSEVGVDFRYGEESRLLRD